MERLDFVLPDFTRLSWVSDDAREVWEPRLRRVTKAWFDMEWLTVVDGVRPCGVTIASAPELIERAGEWARHGLSALPVELEGPAAGNYTATARRPVVGEPLIFRVVLGTPPNVTAFKQAWDAHDNPEIGRLLGYPACCLEFFQRVWVDERCVDTTWAMAVATATEVNGSRSLDVTGPREANILWRWMGARAVPHLPCHFDCAPSAELGKKFIEVGRRAGYGDEMDWLLEMLSWPVEWSALHGIAEIKTPVLKVTARTDATPIKYVVRRPGTAYPAGGIQGLRFPYHMPRKPLETDSQLYRRGLDNAIRVTPRRPEWYASDNGFASLAAMENAHRPVVEVARAALAGNGGNVLDLGCGNGALLHEIREVSAGVVPFGVELEPTRLEHARRLLPAFAANLMLGDMLESDALWADGRRYALALLMPGRLLEAGPERAARLRKRLSERCDALLVYAYGEWLTRFRNLEGLARKAGLLLLSAGPDARASLATYRPAEHGPESPETRETAIAVELVGQTEEATRRES